MMPDSDLGYADAAKVFTGDKTLVVAIFDR